MLTSAKCNPDFIHAKILHSVTANTTMSVSTVLIRILRYPDCEA